MSNTAEEMEEGQNKSSQSGTRRKKTERIRPIRWGTVAVICLCCMIGAGSGVYFIYRTSASEPAPGLRYEANIVSGDIPGKTKEERQRELNSVVEEGMLNMSMNITPAGQVNGSTNERSINWLIENPSNQGKLIRVEVWQDETGEKIYETGAIPPGNYVERAPLLTNLPAGKYNCTAKFFAYKEDETYIGQASAQIQLVLYE